MKKLFNQISVKERTPKRSGWYNTDKGELFWMEDEGEWSCRDDRLSEEYPKVWYESFISKCDYPECNGLMTPCPRTDCKKIIQNN